MLPLLFTADAERQELWSGVRAMGVTESEGFGWPQKWEKICEASRKEFAQLYTRLGVRTPLALAASRLLDRQPRNPRHCEHHSSPLCTAGLRLQVTITERGESFYNPMLQDTVKGLQAAGVVTESEGAQVCTMSSRQHSCLPISLHILGTLASASLIVPVFFCRRSKPSLSQVRGLAVVGWICMRS